MMVAVILLFLAAAPPVDDSVAPVVRMRSELKLDLENEKKEEKKEHTEENWGTGFLVRRNGRDYLITAAHVVESHCGRGGTASEQPPLQGTTYYAKNITFRVWVESKEKLKPERIYLLPSDDIAVMTFSSDDMEQLKRGREPFELSEVGVEYKNNDKVTCMGYPGKGENFIIEKDQTVTAPNENEKKMSEKGVKFINRKVEGGMSGGPVLNAEGQLVGLIQRSSPDRGGFRSVENIIRAVNDFESKSDPYKDGMPVSWRSKPLPSR